MRLPLILALKNILFTLIAPCSIAFYIPFLLTRKSQMASGSLVIISCIFFALGAAVYFWCVWNFAMIGRGTPAPIDAPKKLIVRGLYNYVRNPMYVGLLISILGWAILYRTLFFVGYAILFWLIVTLFIIFYEEPHLYKIFGSEYDQYRAQVGRWIPKLSKGAEVRGSRGE